jgi:Leucine-rich repeat (LRR) protein
MKKIYFLLIGICFFFSGLNAQVINFTDYYVKAKLLQAESYSPYTIAKNLNGNFFKIDSNNNGEIEVSEALQVSYLDLSSYSLNNLDGINNFPNLSELICNNNSLTALDLRSSINLKKLSCSTNRLTSLDVSSQNKLTELICDHNRLTSITINNQNTLAKLVCYSNQFSVLNLNTLSSLIELNCSGNQLSTLDLSNLNDLISLNFGYNKITTIELNNLTKLETLSCDQTLLTSLNLIANSKLKELRFSYNQIKAIDVTNLLNLNSLIFSSNLISSIDLKNNKLLKTLYCENNKLTSLDVSNQNLLTDLYCQDNLLTTLDGSNLKSLFSLNCSNNKLTFLNLKNGINEIFNVAGNINLAFLCIDDNFYEQSTAQNYLSLSRIYNCSLNSYCSFTPGGIYYTIQGNSKLDTNNNGCDNNDSHYSNLNFKITDGTLNGNIISNETGNYSIPVQEGNYTITPILENPTYFNVSPSSVNVSFPTQTSPYTQNFCISPKGVHNDLEVTILPTIPARPGFDATYKIIYKNKGTIVQSGSVTLNFNDAVLDFVSAVPAINNQVTDKLTWDYINLQPFETREITVTLNVNSPMETPAVNIGDRLSFNALINPVTGDEKPVDNSLALRQSVVGSFDPNDKTCLEGDVITPSLIGEYVNYLIRFENTGTYPAENIVVKDLIDLSKFDISTLVPTKASHDFVTKISEGNKVEFIFENINLPFDNATNDGYIAFKIKTLPTLVVGDSFTNEANIYFDYNFPILTNKATSIFKTLGTQDFEFADYFNVYPNPVNDILNIGTKNTIEVKLMSVYDILGQLIIAVPNAQSISKIDVSKLTIGNYFLKMNTDKGTSSVKFIKQ